MADVFYIPVSPYTRVDSTTNNNTDDKYNMRSENLDQSWSAGTTSNTQIWLDRGSVPQSGSYEACNAIALHFYSGSYVNWSSGSPAELHIYQNVAAQDAGKISLNTINISSILGNNQLVVKDLDRDFNLRYVLITLVNMPSADIEIGYIFLGRKETLARTAEAEGTGDFEHFDNTVQQKSGGERQVFQNAKNGWDEYVRQYHCDFDSEIQQFKRIHNRCKGQGNLMIWQPGTTSAEARLVRLVSDRADYVPEGYGLAQWTLQFTEQPFIRSGEKSR